jgi:hypothetical protein
MPAGSDREAANHLRDRCRKDILTALGEPDLSVETATHV